MDSECDNSIQFILVGKSFAGKTELFLSFQNEPFEDFYTQTTGIDFCTKYIKIKDEQFELKVIDTTGKKKLIHWLMTYLKNVMLLYLYMIFATLIALMKYQIIQKDVRKMLPKIF